MTVYELIQHLSRHDADADVVVLRSGARRRMEPSSVHRWSSVNRTADAVPVVILVEWENDE